MYFRKISMLVAVAAAAAGSFAQSLSGNIVIDQFGYREQAKKIAVIRVPQKGPDAPSAYNPGTTFELIDETTGTAVHSGTPVSFRNGQTDTASGDKIWHFDFSAVTESGSYYVLDKTNNVRSFQFKIAGNVYKDVLKAAVKTFYYQRAGTAKPAEYAGEWADGMQFAQDAQTRDFFDKNNQSKFRDLSGGWYDAGDYNKYTKWTADYVAEMLLMYEENPSAFTDDFGIPESGNGVPDILDEAKWGLAWLLKMQNEDGSMLSVQGLSHASPPSSVTGLSYYGPANATAAFGSAKAFAIASRIFGGRGDALYAEELKEAAIKAWDWGFANPDSIFSNNSDSNKSSGLAAGNQEVFDNDWGTGRTTERLENMLTAAWYLFELTEEEKLLTLVEDSLKQFPLFQPGWGSGFMDHYRHSSHLLYIRYINDPRGSQPLKNEVKSMMITAFTRNDDFNSPNGYATDGYRAFIKDYNWGSNKAKADYGMTFYKWHEVDPSVNQSEFKERAEGYLHYIHGVNPFNMVFLSNMNQYGASRSQKEFYHSWFGEGTNWSANPAPGFLPGGPNKNYGLDCCCSNTCDKPNPNCGSADNFAKCSSVDVPNKNVTPPAKMYVETNRAWPINSWEITENSNGYQLGYIRLLSKFVEGGGHSSIKQRGKTPEVRAGGIQYKKLRMGFELRVKENAEVKIFAINGA
ncbi:MAG: glycoside hydrolase family 9 protein, partial [Chitinispirillales bacterium]|nr:glycoside hydrolase family 9 protein [Chitinispirillales bacterium]